MPQFNSLNGQELKKIVLAEIEKDLDNSGAFAQNIAYPWAKLNWSINLTSYPQRPPDADPIPVATGGIEAQIEGGKQEAPEALAEVAINREVPLVLDTPDQARADAGLPLPTPTPVPNVGVVDKPVMQAPAKKGK